MLEGLRRRSSAGLVVVVTFALLSACKDEQVQSPVPATSESASVVAPKAPRDALMHMRWILGTFRGAGDEGTAQEPFYERYSLADDSTLVVESFKDSSLTGAIDSTRFELRGDSLSNRAGGPRWTAGKVSADSVTFVPRERAHNSFTWRRGGDESYWMAVIITPRPDGTLNRRVYRMARIR